MRDPLLASSTLQTFFSFLAGAAAGACVVVAAWLASGVAELSAMAKSKNIEFPVITSY